MTPKDTVRQLDRLAVWIARLLVSVSVASTVVLMIVITYGVVMRFVFDDAQNWTDELASFSLAWLVFFGLAYTLATNGHVRVTFFTRFLSAAVIRVVEVATYAIGLAFSVLLFVGCLSAFDNFIKRETHSMGGLDIPLYYPAAALLVGSAAFGLVMLMRGLCVLTEGVIKSNAGSGETLE